MKWISGAGLSAILIVGVVAGIGLALPKEHVASVSAEFAGSPEDVYDVIADYRNYPKWWSEVKRVEVLGEQADGAWFREYLSDGPVAMMVTERSRPNRFATKIQDPSLPYGGSWTFDLVEAGAGYTRVTITERGEINNPIFRALGRFVFGYTGTMDRCLAALSKKLT